MGVAAVPLIAAGASVGSTLLSNAAQQDAANKQAAAAQQVALLEAASQPLSTDNPLNLASNTKVSLMDIFKKQTLDAASEAKKTSKLKVSDFIEPAAILGTSLMQALNQQRDRQIAQANINLQAQQQALLSGGAGAGQLAFPSNVHLLSVPHSSGVSSLRGLLGG